MAYTEINGYRYFTTKKELEDCDLYVIDPKGYYMLSNKVDNVEPINKIKIVPIYVTTSYDIARKRAAERGDDLKTWDERYESEDEQFRKFENYILEYSLNAYVINNDGLFLDSLGIMKYIILKEMDFKRKGS